MNVDAMIKHHQAVTEVITHAMSDYASAATGTSWNKACFAFEADAILCALSRAGFRIIGPDEVDPVTVEKCASIADADGRRELSWAEMSLPVSPGPVIAKDRAAVSDRIASAIRALATKEEGNE